MFSQLLAPVADSLGLSFLVAVLPVVTVLVLLGLFRLAAWQAALAGLIVGFTIAVAVWQMPAGLAASAVINGAVFALGGDLGCLMNIAGKLSRGRSKVRVMHAAEVLAGMGDVAIGEEA